MSDRLQIVIIGLSITSSWGNGHATTYRALTKALSDIGHDVLFLEQDVPWYSANRDCPHPAYCRTELYKDVASLKRHWKSTVRNADAVIVGSYVVGGIEVADWVVETALGVTAFYDIDTPVTLAKLAKNECDYLTSSLVGKFDLYLSFAGGPTLDKLERDYGSPMARPLYCSFDPALYYPESRTAAWDLGYMGTYSADRQPTLDAFLIEPARYWPDGRFVVAGPQYPSSMYWPTNVQRLEHMPPGDHRAFYNSQRYTLNVTRADMISAGYSPSVRLFEAAACGVPIISDYWKGLEMFFAFDDEILVASSTHDVYRMLTFTTEQAAEQTVRRLKKMI